MVKKPQAPKGNGACQVNTRGPTAWRRHVAAWFDEFANGRCVTKYLNAIETLTRKRRIPSRRCPECKGALLRPWEHLFLTYVQPTRTVEAFWWTFVMLRRSPLLQERLLTLHAAGMRPHELRLWVVHTFGHAGSPEAPDTLDEVELLNGQ